MVLEEMVWDENHEGPMESSGRRGQPLDNDSGDERSREGGSYSVAGPVLNKFHCPHSHSQPQSE